MAQLLKTPYPLPELEFNLGRDWRQSAHEIAFRELCESGKPMIKFPVADGFAHYLVVSMQPLKLQHVPHGDGYSVLPATIRGLRKADVEVMIERQKRWNF